MPKNTKPVDPNAELDARAADLIARTDAFCKTALNDEYATLCARLIGKMRRKKVVPFATGRPEIWAAAVVYALGQINFLFDLNETPHSTPDAIADFFGTSKTTVGLKAKAIRELFKLRRWDGEFCTASMAAHNPFAMLVMVNDIIIPVPGAALPKTRR
jgi:Domain of unknown function (DUF6398)